ncbi:hypothetical protein DL96DRAFT_1709872 [Flagelloscypha sp. PMI_526]|nr:hypothetical protein DL96DRAFT_1709872 [Flagelloscypha sp. PMI_526]
MPNPAHDAETRDLALLSLDSGRFESLSGLSQLFILQEILHTYESDHDLGEDTVKAYEVFDLIVGTGSGGLVACLLGPLRMSISEAIEAYLRIHTTVFASERQIVSIEENTRRLRDALQALIDARLSPTEQESAFSNFDNLVPRCMVVVTALSKAHVEYPTAFRSFRGRRANPPPCSLLEAVLSTLAHPHHFSEVTLKKGSIPLSFIAADLGHCNPLESLVAEVQDRFKNRSIALIVSIGTGSPNPINLEGADDFARAASEQATRCHSISERFEKMLHGHPGAYVRLDADGYDASTILSSSNVMAHVMGYLRQAKIVSKLDMVAEGMNERHGQIKVSEISFPKASFLYDSSFNAMIFDIDSHISTIAHIPTLDSDKYKIYGRGEIILVKRIGEGSGIESWEAKDKSNNNNLVTVHRFSDREKMGDLMKLQQG